MIIEKRFCSPEYINGLNTWEEVKTKLCEELPQGTIRVCVYKFSSNNKTLGYCPVTMHNMAKVINASNDKEVLC